MNRISRLFSSLLFLLLILIGLDLAGSWHIRHHLDPEPAQSPISGQADGATAGDRDRIAEIKSFRLWATASEIAALGLGGILCALGLWIRLRSAREERAREHAERELDRERRELEKRIDERTRELRCEVEERRRAEELNRGHKQVLEMLAGTSEHTIEDILNRLAASVASQRRSWECSIHLVEGATLRLAASSEVSEKLKRYLASIGADFPDAPESQACASGQPCVTAKLTEARRPWSEMLVANGILSAWSMPIRVDAASSVAGTLTVYTRLQTSPSDRDLELLETAANLAGLVIAHRRIHAELMRNAYQDALTGVANRRAGELALASAIDRASRASESVGVLWIDLDRFKRINDQHGHSVGDEVLRTIADRLRVHPLVTGGVARMGGDEFLVLLTGESGRGDLTKSARRLEAEISLPIRVGATTVTTTASIGISAYPQDGTAIDILERNADFAMYRAKSAGSGTCLYSPALSAEVQDTIEMEEALSVALERNYLRVHYQPLFTSEGRLFGYEALLRFEHPKLGNVPPSRFIPIAEETRQIVPIGNWILREACRQLQTWRKSGLPPVRMSVNISALQFVRADFAENVEALLAETGLDPEYLTLELTESVVMEDYASVIRQMNLLKECGVRIAMDDFGTGYSSLSYIHRLPIDVLRIDRSFIDRIVEPEGTRPIVEAVIAMGRHLGLAIVAEGVETEEQHRILRQAGCQGFQGYLFARPVPAEQAERLLWANLPMWAAAPRMQGSPALANVIA